MSLSRKIAAAVDDHITSGPANGAVRAEDGPHRLTLDLLQASPVGVEIQGLEFAVNDRPDWSLDALKAWGDRLAARVTYLMEPLVILEADPVGGEVELRSKTPTTRDGRRAYYEARLDRNGTLRLFRVTFDETDRTRRTTPYQLTREVLERLTDDLVASVA